MKRCVAGHLYSEKKHGSLCPYCDLSRGQEGLKGSDPLGQYNETYLDELADGKRVVGWLVCVFGQSKGKAYQIFPAKNFIGRSAEMDIRILGDENIEPRNHAVILYDPERNNTHILAGDSRGLAYKLDANDAWEIIHEPRELSAGDRLKIGNSEFMFVPFCGDNEGFKFSWQDAGND